MNEIISKERVIQILQDYVYNDVEAADTCYVRDILQDICGCTDDEMEYLGFGFLLDTDDE